MVELFVQLDHDIIFMPYQSQAGQDLSVQVCLAIGELLLAEALVFLKQTYFIINLHSVQSIEQLDDFQVFRRGVSLDIELKIPFL